MQYRTGEGDWTTVNPESIEGNTLNFAKIGGSLLPETAYQFRSIYDNNAAEVSDNVVVTTEAAAQVPNAGFEEWCSEVVQEAIKVNIVEWYPKELISDKGFWATRNDLTTSPRYDATNFYCAYSGTIKSDKGHNDSSCAEISTVGWGKYNTFTLLGGKCSNITPGMLFIGDYINNTELFGKEFHSRPDAFEFYYKFAPVKNESFKAYIVVENREGDSKIELGRGEILSNVEVKEFSKQTVKVTYSNITKIPTHMYIVFMSSSADSPSVNSVTGSMGAFSGYADSRYVGSVLTVDDVNLIYE